MEYIALIIFVWLYGVACVVIIKKLEPDYKIYPLWVLLIVTLFTVFTICHKFL